jgi:GAF domain-containing protein
MMPHSPFPPLPQAVFEQIRLKRLKALKIVGGGRDHFCDGIVALASTIAETPIAAISLVEEKRQWFKASTGLNLAETLREVAFCAHTIQTPNQPLLVFDATLEDRFSNNPLVTGAPNIRAYGGFAIRTHDAFSLGALCVIDTKPRKLEELQIRSLAKLAQLVSDYFEEYAKTG